MNSPPPRVATPADTVTVARLLDAFNREYHTPTPGPEVLATRLRRLLSGTDVIAFLAGDPAVAVMTGQHTGVFNGIAPTGRSITHKQVHIFTVAPAA